MNINQLRSAYIDFFKSKNHKQISGASLIPENDPTVLFTTAGMHPLVPYLTGEKHPSGVRLCNCQKCIRTGDIEEVGDTQHLTFFEMLGNWSLGDYFKQEAIEMSNEFLTSKNWLGLKKEKLYFTIFQGDNIAKRDTESFEIWRKLGIKEDHLFYLDRKNNWWGPAGKTGPCGPDTEMFFDSGLSFCSESCKPGCSCGKFVEIWNDVFMQYNKINENKFQLLNRKNVDTGMGLERTVSTINGFNTVFDIPSLKKIILEVDKASTKTVDKKSHITALRIITDHIKAATFIIGDPMGVPPSNLDQGYIVRRLIRRAMRYSMLLGIENNLSELLVDLITELNPEYPELKEKSIYIKNTISKEEERFKKTLSKGMNEFNKILPNVLKGKNKIISGKVAFRLYDTYGFPLDLTKELAKEHNISIDEKGYNKAFEKHQELSRAGSDIKFKGGLSDAGEQTKKLHTATHLLHEALRRILGDHIQQKGSNITQERLRFDFSHPQAMTKEEKEQVEKLVNEIIEKNLDIIEEFKTLEQAEMEGAIALFVDKYAEKVKVYSIGDFSKEVCGGPHVKNTSELGKFKIKKEQSSSAGIRRIKAVLNE